MQDKYLCLVEFLTKELDVSACSVKYLIDLLEQRFSVPFIAKYYKSKIDGMSHKNIRRIANAVKNLHEFEERRLAIIKCIESQNKLSKELLELINKADSLEMLEDLYLPYRPKRQTKALQARERGLDALATELLTSYAASLEDSAESFVNVETGVLNNKMALEGARQILLEKFAEDAGFLNSIRTYFFENAELVVLGSKARNDKHSVKYKEFANYSKPISQIPPQKLFTIFEGRAANYLKISVNFANSLDYGFNQICNFFGLDKIKVTESSWLFKIIEDTWLLKLQPKFEAEILHKLRDIAASSISKELSSFLRGLFFMPSAGNIVTMGLIPNAKSGVAVAVIDEFGNYLDNCVMYPLGMYGDWYQSLASLAKLAIKYKVSLLSIANLPGYRDIERLSRQLARMYPDLSLSVNIVDSYGLLEYAQTQVSAQESFDAGALAAISVARRAQDPLAEFAKLNGKDLSLAQQDFGRATYQAIFDQVLEDAICAVGLDLNKASQNMLSKLPGVNIEIAEQIIAYRQKNGKFKSRLELKNVPGIDEFIFQQISGFVYVYGGNNILDTLNIHPDYYYVVDNIASKLDVDLPKLISNNQLLDKIILEQYIDDKCNIDCLRDIIHGLKYKFKDPRGLFELPKISHNFNSINELIKDTELEGIVSKITSFGAFVDIGIYQDGLIPLTLLKEKTSTNLKVGKIVKVKVLEVDKNKKRFSLALKTKEIVDTVKAHKVNKIPEASKNKHKPAQTARVFNTAMADALAKLKKENN